MGARMQAIRWKKREKERGKECEIEVPKTEGKTEKNFKHKRERKLTKNKVRENIV